MCFQVVRLAGSPFSCGKLASPRSA